MCCCLKPRSSSMQFGYLLCIFCPQGSLALQHVLSALCVLEVLHFKDVCTLFQPPLFNMTFMFTCVYLYLLKCIVMHGSFLPFIVSAQGFSFSLQRRSRISAGRGSARPNFDALSLPSRHSAVRDSEKYQNFPENTVALVSLVSCLCPLPGSTPADDKG